MSTPPGYYDRFDPATKNWKKVLFLPGKPVQAAEFNEIQSILGYEHEQLASSFYKEGAAVSGLNVILIRAAEYPALNVTDHHYNVGDHVSDGPDGYVCLVDHISAPAETLTLPNWISSAVYAILTPGRIYAQGFIHAVPGGEVEVSLTGNVKIGILVENDTLTELQDASLKDPAVGFEGYGYPGAHRMTFSYTLVVDDPLSVTIAELIDGQIDQTYQQARPVMEPVLKVLAKRTADQSGSYSIQPFKVELGRLPTNDAEYDRRMMLVLRGGAAYVVGWYVQNSVIYFRVDRPLDLLAVRDEPFNYASAGPTEFSLANGAVFNASSLSAVVEVGPINRTRAAPADSLDELPPEYQPVESILEVKQGGTTYAVTTDYTRSGNSVNWGPAGAEPVVGTEYTVKFRYVKQMVQAIRTLTSVTNQAVTRAAESGTSDYDYPTPQVSASPLRYAEIHSVSKVNLGPTTYVENTHYTVEKHTGKIVWVTGGPSNGQVYTVTMFLWDHTVEGDYVSRDSFTDGADPLYWLAPIKTQSGLTVDYTRQFSLDTANGDRPVDGSVMYVTYSRALPRKDVLAIDTRGIVACVKGVSALIPKAPMLSPDQMEICTFYYPAEALPSDVKILYEDNQRLTMVQLRTLLRMVKDIQYNEAVFQLHQEVDNFPLPTDKKAIWADNFSTPLFADITNVLFDCSFDFIRRYIALPQEVEIIDLIGGGTATKIAGYYIIPYGHEKYMEQPYATTTVLVNAYTRVNLGANIVLDPSLDRWFDTANVTIEVQGADVILPDRAILNHVIIYTNVLGVSVGSVLPPGWYSQYRSTVQTQTSTQRILTWDEIQEQIQVVSAPNARIIPINITGANWFDNEDDVAFYFDGVRVNATPVAPSTPGAAQGTINADPSGTLACTITVPVGTKAGPHRIDARGEGTLVIPGSRATAPFVSDGKTRTITTFITHNRSIQNEAITTTEDHYLTWIDPIAQTFFPPQSVFLTKVDLWFTQRPGNAGLPVVVDIRDVVSGFPGQNVLATRELFPVDVSTTVATTFVFDHPCYVEAGKEYCIVVRTDSELYSVKIAKTGDLDPINGFVNTNPNSGVLLTSANLSTWSAVQNADLKFTLWNAAFSATSATVDYGLVTFSGNRSRFEFSASMGVPGDKTWIQLQYSLDGSHWYEFSPYIENDLRVMVATVRIRAVLNRDASVKLSPVIFDDAFIRASRWLMSGVYVNRQVTTPLANSRYVDVWYDAYEVDSVTSVVPKVKIEAGAYVDMDAVTDDTVDFGSGWKEYHWTYDNDPTDVGAANHFDQSNVRVNMTTNSQPTSPLVSRLRMATRGL